MIISHEKIGSGWLLTDRYGGETPIENDIALYFMMLGAQAQARSAMAQQYLDRTGLAKKGKS